MTRNFTPEEILNVKAFADEPPAGSRLAFTEDEYRNLPSGDLFAGAQNVAMGMDPSLIQMGTRVDDYLIVSTQGGLRGPNGENIATGLHTGHWELGLLVEDAATAFKAQHASPYSVTVSDPCDGRTQGTSGMMDSLAYRNAAATTMGHLIRSLPTRKGVLGIASCDKGAPAMMMALAEAHDMPTIFVPGGVTLPTRPTPNLQGFEHGVNAANIQAVGTMVATGKLSVDEANELGCKACGTPGGGCQFLGTAATAQVVGEALGLSLPHSALIPSGQPIWHDMGKRSAEALINLRRQKIATKDILTKEAIENAMVVHAAFGGSTNLLLHIPAIARTAGVIDPATGKLWWPVKEDWERINAATPRLVDVLPNSPRYTTVHAFMAGGVPEVMLHLRKLGLLHLDVKTVTGKTLRENLEEWEISPRRSALRSMLKDRDGIDPDDIIFSPERAHEKGLTSTVTFPGGNLAPQGSVIKSTAIDPGMLNGEGVYHTQGRARIFTSEEDAMMAIKQTDPYRVRPLTRGEVLILMGYGPLGMGMPETFQITRALKDAHFTNPLLTDGRFSGVSTGACIGHIGPEALAGGPLGKLRDGDIVDIHVDTRKLIGRVDFVGTDADRIVSSAEGAQMLSRRTPHPDLKPHPDLPPSVRIWAAEQEACGGVWGGCYRDEPTLTEVLRRGMEAQAAILAGKPGTATKQ